MAIPERDLAWPFFDDSHRTFVRELQTWVDGASVLDDEREPDSSCRAWVRALAGAGWLKPCIELDVRRLCLARETLAYESALADFAFAMQGLGSGAITLFGSDALKKRWLESVTNGRAIAAFALSEREAGSDVAALATTARRVKDEYLIDGEKTWISNAGLADFYVTFARTGGEGSKGLSAFVVNAATPGLTVAGRS